MALRDSPVTVVTGVQYAAPDGVPLSADLFLPDTPAGRSAIVVWVHGGGWRFGTRRAAPDLSRLVARAGFAMAAIDYRLTDRATFPAQIEDLKTAIRWLRSVASHYGLERDRIGLVGASAGGHLAALAALTAGGTFEPDAAPYREESSSVQAVVVGYAPIEFLRLDADRPPDGTASDDPENLRMRRGGGMRAVDPDSFESLLLGAPIETCPDRVRAANPVAYAAPGAPPFLILHGRSDTTIGFGQSEALYDALAQHGNDVTLGLIDGLGHGFLSRTHLDDAGPRRVTLRRPRNGGHEVETREQAIFPLVEAFLAAHLLT